MTKTSVNRVGPPARSYRNPKAIPFGRAITIIAAAVSLGATSSFAALNVGVNFQGRDSSGTNAPVAGLAATDVTGVVPSSNWNNVNDAYGEGLATFTKAENGTTGPLNDSTGAVTPVTLTFAANDSWNNDVDLSTNTTATAKMMKGVIKQQNTNTSAVFTFNNVPDATYDLYVYTDSNNDNVALNITDSNSLKTYYTVATHQFYDTSTFAQAKNTNPSGPRDVGNYVKLSSIPTFGKSTLGFTAKYISGGDGLGIAGIQLVEVGGPVSPRLLDFQFNEGKGTNTVDSVNGLVGILGVGMTPDLINVPVSTNKSPAGIATDRALALNLGTVTNAALVVNDAFGNNAPEKILAFPTNAPFTMETWINIATNDNRQYEGLGAYGKSYKLGLTATGPTYTNQQVLFTLFGIVDIFSGIYPTKGEWHHVAAAWTPGTGVEFFMDGTSVTNVAETRVPRPYQNNLLTIGAENVGTNMQVTFKGMMDRFRIHSGALTADQLDSVAATPKAAFTNTVVSYNFNETNWPFASSATEPRPAVPNPSPFWTNNTPSGQSGDFALSFSPGTQVVVPDTNTVVRLDTNNPAFTMQAWVNFKGNPAARQVLFFSRGPGGALSFSVFTNRTVFVTTLGKADVSSKAAIPDDGNWHHIAVVHENGKELRFYVDDVLGDTVPYTQGVTFTTTNQVFYIGSEPTFGLQYTGMLDRLQVSSGMLTPAQFDYPAGGTPPTVLEVGALEGGVGVVFDRAVSAATATNPANYTVAGGTVTNATLVSPNYVILGVSPVPTNAFAVTVTGITTPVGDVMTAPATLTAPATPGGTITDGLVAHWSFDGHLSDSIDGFDGVARGKVPVAFVDGPSAAFGKSLKLTGTNYVEIPGSSNTLQFANSSLSIAGWFKVDTFDKSWQALIAKGENLNYRVARNGTSTNILYAGGVGEGPADTPNVNDGKWHHFVAVSDAAAVKFGTALYIDGVIHSIQTNKPALAAGTANLFIGENPEALNRQWIGEIDDIGLWNRVLAQQEIDMLYNGGQGTPLGALPGVNLPVPEVRPYSIGLNFGADQPNTNNPAVLTPLVVAGVIPQANWNNFRGQNGTNVNNVVADTDFEVATNTTVEVTWVSNGTWASTGLGEENNKFPAGADYTLMTGYLDTGAPSTTTVTITNIPAALTSTGYDVYVYAMGGVGGRGGGYRILEAGTTNVLSPYVRVQSPTNSTDFIAAPISTTSTNYAVGNYFVWTDLTAPAITIEATTDHGFGFGGTHRAPINAIQLVGMAGPVGPALSIERTAGGITITFEGTLQSTQDITSNTWTDVPGTSPITVTPTGTATFYRAKQ